MNLFTKMRLLAHIAHWRLTWSQRDLDYRVKGVKNSKFMTAREAVKLIPDEATVISSGMAGNTRCSVFFYAIRELFERTGHPQHLTWMTVGAQGSRGRVPGTLEELALPGLLSRQISGHLETYKAQLRLADAGQIELHTMAQGVQTFLLEAQARGELSLELEAGVGTFLDPRVGNGTAVTPNASENFVEAAGDKLRYHLPPFNVAVFVLPYADKEGNLYKHHTCMVTESLESALAVRRNGGVVLGSVCDIIEKDESRIFIKAQDVDAIVVNPYSEQTGSVQQRKYWPMFTVEHRVDTNDAVEQLKFANNVLKITPVRGRADNALARMAASMFVKAARPGSLVNIGVGLPEEVSRLLYEGGMHEDVTFFTETGVVGGLPTPGIFFGAAINPLEIIPSAQVFHRAYEKLDVTILGLLEADSDGNVNVSNRGDGAINYVGPGGFPDLTTAANTIFFVGSWMAHGKFDIVDGELKILKAGPCKFMERVREITFSGKMGLKRKQNVYYVTNVGVFKLTEQGMMLVEVMPGIDVKRDILEVSPMKIVLPEGKIPVVSRRIVTGENFKLKWENGVD